MYLVGSIAISAFIGYLCGTVFGPLGLLFSLPIAMVIGWYAGKLQAQEWN